jgi:hypothetical protein
LIVLLIPQANGADNEKQGQKDTHIVLTPSDFFERRNRLRYLAFFAGSSTGHFFASTRFAFQHPHPVIYGHNGSSDFLRYQEPFGFRSHQGQKFRVLRWRARSTSGARAYLHLPFAFGPSLRLSEALSCETTGLLCQ